MPREGYTCAGVMIIKIPEIWLHFVPCRHKRRKNLMTYVVNFKNCKMQSLRLY